MLIPFSHVEGFGCTAVINECCVLLTTDIGKTRNRAHGGKSSVIGNEVERHLSYFDLRTRCQFACSGGNN